MKHSNVSVFVPHVGCPNKCSFCDQRTISGSQSAPTAEQVREICSKAVSQVKSLENAEIAFFGGSFTAIPEDYMIRLLETAHDFLGADKFKGIRISTRPDCIDEKKLELLKKYGVTSIELGAQSMKDEVLAANNRGHTAEDVRKASLLIKEYGFELGLQMMVGLYKSSQSDEFYTFNEILSLRPDTLRIYPVVILNGTELGELYKSGEFVPFEFETVVDMCADLISKAEENGVRVIKVGLHASEFVEKDMLGGFYHPAFRELCEGRIYRRKFEQLLSGSCVYGKFSVPERELSKAAGHKKCNIEHFKKKNIEIEIIPDKSQTEPVVLLERR